MKAFLVLDMVAHWLLLLLLLLVLVLATFMWPSPAMIPLVRSNDPH